MIQGFRGAVCHLDRALASLLARLAPLALRSGRTAGFPRPCAFGTAASSRPGSLRSRRVRVQFFCTLLLAGAFSSARAETLVVLVRHAEKVDESRESDLSATGRARAQALAAMLKDSGIGAVYSTDTLRTRETARPLAELLSTPIEIYDGDGLEAFAKALRSRGGRALVVGHSDTTPELVSLLGGEPGPAIFPDEYDRLYILILSEDGKVSTTVLRFPTGDSK